ncbi:DUF1990 domain-containing protein [Actinocorallia longicatena]|uniref:DUF1990 domain-containing protein n=1 Tax=Actinocorallia longicatena TaxID=111803 RepID=A0ABP6QKY2_9ACTN
MSFTYAEVGATRTGDLPDGYQKLRVSRVVGHGPEAYRKAGEALMTFRMHRRIPVGLVLDRPRAAPDGLVTVRLAGVIKAPCRIIWTVEDETETGWAYGTLEGHPERGEESFLLELRPDGAVTLTVTAFSRAAHPLARLAEPLIPAMQRLYALRCCAVLRRLAR